jgi:hypothetical protein
MEQSKIVVKSKANKNNATKKVSLTTSNNEVAPTVVKTNGLILTLDNSIQKYAKDPFFVKKAEEANRKFARSKTDL